MVGMFDEATTENGVQDSLKYVDGSNDSGPDKVYPTIINSLAKVLMKSFIHIFIVSLAEERLTLISIRVHKSEVRDN